MMMMTMTMTIVQALKLHVLTALHLGIQDANG